MTQSSDFIEIPNIVRLPDGSIKIEGTVVDSTDALTAHRDCAYKRMAKVMESKSLYQKNCEMISRWDMPHAFSDLESLRTFMNSLAELLNTVPEEVRHELQQGYKAFEDFQCKLSSTDTDFIAQNIKYGTSALECNEEGIPGCPPYEYIQAIEASALNAFLAGCFPSDTSL